MPPLKKTTHERFAQELANGATPEAAYERAGLKPHRQNAHRMMTNDDIIKRVHELQKKAARKCVVTVESLSQELEEARGVAISEKQASAAVSATMGKAKLFGLGVENRRLSGTIQVVSVTPKQLDTLTDDELAALEEAYPVLQKLGVVGGDTGDEAEADEGS